MKDLIKTALPTTLIIFGATGDLAKRKIIPALWKLHQQNAFPEKFRVVGFSRRYLSNAEFRAHVKKSIPAHKKSLRKEKQFLNFFFYNQGTFTNKLSYQSLAKYLYSIDEEWKMCSSNLFYLAVPPKFYPIIAKNLSKYGLTDKCSKEDGWTRVLVEKPFGKDEKTAAKLDRLFATLFREEQIFRVDHYLAKTTMQNIITFRFSNPIFEPIWNHKYIEKIEIKFLENLDIGTRGEFYDDIGALRDIGQNHMLQMLALTAMENPGKMKGTLIRKERAKVLNNLKIMTPKQIKCCTIRGQYKNYDKTPGVKKHSTTETYFKIKAHINNERWKNVPFYLESGKGLKRTKKEIVVYFKGKKPCLCPKPHENHLHQNVLTFKIDPDEGINIRFWTKKPQLTLDIVPKNLSFTYKEPTRVKAGPYQKLLFDAILGGQMLFASTDEVLASWKFITPILKHWKRTKLHIYNKGSAGPQAEIE